MRNLFILLITSLLIIACDSADSISPAVLEPFEFPMSGQLPDEGAPVLRLSNHLGGIMITGKTPDGMIDYYINRIILAETQEDAQIAADNLTLLHLAVSDTMELSLQAPTNTETLEYYGLLSINPGFESDCSIDFANGGIYASDMDGSITVQNCTSSIEVERHNGNCDVQTISGDILIEAAFPADGNCSAHTYAGDIHILIPDTTSATISAQSQNGTITVENLDISLVIDETDQLSGTMGDGETPIDLVTDNGDIFIIGFDTGR